MRTTLLALVVVALVAQKTVGIGSMDWALSSPKLIGFDLASESTVSKQFFSIPS